MFEGRPTIVYDIALEKFNNDLFKMKGSAVDFSMKEEDIPHFPHHKHIYRTDEFGEIEKGLGHVGKDYPLTTHRDFFSQQHDMMQSKFSANELDNLVCKYKISRDGAWALQDITFPNVKFPIESRKQKTEIGLRNVSWHSVDSSASNNALFGAIDFFCTNGMVNGEYDVVRKKNTKNFDMKKFIDEIEKSVEEFYATVEKYQTWATRDITFQNVQKVIEFLPVSKGKKDKLLTTYVLEADVRGNNMWALYSTFTNYSSHHKGNGFSFKESKHDHVAQSMLKREFEVADWIHTEEFVKLAA
jgi:hypothetical protein